MVLRISLGVSETVYCLRVLNSNMTKIQTNRLLTLYPYIELLTTNMPRVLRRAAMSTSNPTHLHKGLHRRPLRHAAFFLGSILLRLLAVAALGS